MTACSHVLLLNSTHIPPLTHSLTHSLSHPPPCSQACFSEYLQQRKVEEKEEARQAVIKAKENFITMLDGCPQITAASKFSKARDVLESDMRWQAVDARQREELFAEYVKDRDRREREARRSEAKRREETLRGLFERTGVVVRWWLLVRVGK